MNEREDGIRLYGIVTVGERGQIVIPKEARDELDIRPKEKLLILGEPNKCIIITRAAQVRKFAVRLLRAFGEESVEPIEEKS